MGYFSNSTEAEFYINDYCARCVHNTEHGCPVLMAHWRWAYDECNKDDSVLHKMIPRGEGGRNLECVFLCPRGNEASRGGQDESEAF